MTNDELDAVLLELVHAEREGLRRFLEHLIEFDDQKGPGTKAYTSLFSYCRGRLRLSESETFRRIQAARICKECRLVLDRIESGAVNLSIVSVLAPHLTPENQQDLLDRAKDKSKRDVEFIVAGLDPKPIPRDVVPASVAEFNLAASGSSTVVPDVAATIVHSPRKSEKVEVLTPTLVRIHFNATRAVLDKLDRARSLLRHKFPKGDYNDVLGAALDTLLDRKDPDRKERAAPQVEVLPDRRRIPQWVKDEVWRRDNGRCTFESIDRQRCGETSWLEYDHKTPFALGGRSDDPSNIRLLCRAHNQHAARDVFGD